MSAVPAGHEVPMAGLPGPGALTTCVVAGLALAIANVDGDFYAFQDQCTHEDCSLSTGFLEGHHVVCDCHGGEFDVRTGAPVGGPVLRPLAVYAVSASVEGIRIGVEPADASDHPAEQQGSGRG